MGTWSIPILVTFFLIFILIPGIQIISAEEVPSWIKANAAWWAEGQIDDGTFLQGISFLIKEGIMVIPPTEIAGSSESQEVPSWVKNNAAWWAEGQIDDGTFVSGIQFLVKNGIISVEQKITNRSSAGASLTKFDVIVVGAGISGLAAADKLDSQGFDVVILEARDRTGGRMWSHLWNGIIIEEGANWIHISVGNPITILSEKNGFKMIENQSDDVTYWNEKYIDQGTVYKITTELNDAIASAQNSTDQDISLGTMYNQFKTTKNLSVEEEIIYDYFFHSMLEQEYATEVENLSLWWHNIGGDDFGEGEIILPDGYDQITHLLEKGLDIRLEHVVEKIEYGDEGVVVSTSQGSFESKIVLVTVPLGVLKSGDIEFAPPLPMKKKQAIEDMGMGLLQKHFLLFDEVFWDEAEWIYSITDDHHWECTDFTFTGKPILVCFTLGEYAKMQEALSDKAITEDVMRTLRSAYGNSVPDPIDTYFTKWASDKFSYGSYSYTAVGNTPNTYKDISEPIMNRVFFAGEHTSELYPATVHGAYLSGLREAERISNTLDK